MIRSTFALALMSIAPTCGDDDASSTPPPPSAASEPTAPMPGMRPYDRAAETTVTGVVRSVEVMDHGPQGLHVRLAVDGEILEVHLGPTWYADEIGLAPNVGDRLDVTGARTGDVVIAREVVRDDRTWTLRDPTGRPAWAGRGRGPRA
jgi:hypothetical protein